MWKKRKDEDAPLSRPISGLNVSKGRGSDLRSRFNRSAHQNMVTEPSATPMGRRSRLESGTESLLDTITAKSKGTEEVRDKNASTMSSVRYANNQKGYDLTKNFIKRQSFIDLHKQIESCSKEKLKPPGRRDAKFYCKDHLKRYV